MSASECDILKVIYEISRPGNLFVAMHGFDHVWVSALSPLPVVGDCLFEIVASRIGLGSTDNDHRATEEVQQSDGEHEMDELMDRKVIKNTQWM